MSPQTDAPEAGKDRQDDKPADPDPPQTGKPGEGEKADKKPFPWAFIVGLVLVAALTALATAWFITSDKGDDDSERPLATFIHATDPHLFLERSFERGEEAGRGKREWQERLDRAALREMLTTAGNLPEEERPEFILFTGDWGIDTSTVRTSDPADTTTPPPSTAPVTNPPAQPAVTDTGAAADSARAAAARAAAARAAAAGTGAAPADPRWTAQADTAAVILNASPIKRIYWVPGNNDIAKERADLGSLGQADQFNTLVAQRLRNGVTIQNLTACFTGAGGCSVDVPDTRYTVVGIPTVSFKNKAKVTADTAGNGVAQAAILARSDTIVTAEAGRNRRVLIATHIPELDDPFIRGQQLFAGVAPSRPALGASAWNVTDSAFAAWKRLVESPGVAAVLAGHFHDSHREVYQRPYAWAESSVLRSDPGKLLLVPPLSVKNQDASPVQARGFALIRLFADSVDRRMFWMDAAGHFVEEHVEPPSRSGRRGEASPAEVKGPRPRWLFPTWLWQVGDALGNPAQMAIFLLGLLIAFLTVAALWEVPEPKPASTAGAAPAAGDGASSNTTAGAVFTSNLGRTVLGGLTGIAGVALLQDVLGTGSNNGGKAYFLAVFITYFFWILVLSAALRGAIEGLRARVTTPTGVHLEKVPYPAWSRFVRWVQSFYRPFLVFADTTVNVLFGRGLRQAKIWEQRFDDLQKSLLRTINLTRGGLSEAIGAALKQKGYSDLKAGRDYRVNVSLLSESSPEAFYVAKEENSLDRVFGAQSLAYVAIQSGEARWWKVDYMPGPTRLRSAARLRTGTPDAPGSLPPLDTPATSLVALPRGSGAVALKGEAIAVVGKRADGTDVNAKGNAGTVQQLLKFLGGSSAFGSGDNPAAATLDRDGYLLVQTRETGGSLSITSLVWGEVELGPFVGNPPEVVLFRNDPKIFKDEPQLMLLGSYFEARSNLDYEAFVLIPLPQRRRVEGSRERRGGLHISFRLAGYLDALWPNLDQVTNGTLLPTYNLQNQLLDATFLPDPELRASLAMATKVLGEAIQQLNDIWLRDHLHES